jgi:homoserine trans-succinylase
LTDEDLTVARVVFALRQDIRPLKVGGAELAPNLIRSRPQRMNRIVALQHERIVVR